MRTTSSWKVTLLCGLLAAPLALASGAEETGKVPEAARAALTTEAAPESPVGLLDESMFFMEDNPEESPDAPLLRYAEPLSCPAVPEGRVWVADVEACGESECIHQTTVWLGSWTVTDTDLEVRCETDRVVLSTPDWQWVLAPDATGSLEVAEATPAEESEAAPAEPM
ncbi:hypothetical protein ACLESO_18230 [Pyxidicoccus sp. 3LG]